MNTDRQQVAALGADKLYTAKGTCNTCGKYSSAKGSTGTDAIQLLGHNHGIDHGHVFEGVVTVGGGT